MSRKKRDRMTVMSGGKRQELTLVQAAELMAVTHRARVRLGSAFDGTGFAATGPVGPPVLCQHTE